jgi:hypothetical protein
MIQGGAGRQWVHLLARHVADGGRATIVAPRGPLSEVARRAGIVTVDRPWSLEPRQDAESVRRLVSGHDAAIVHWDHLVMHSFGPALAACGRAALMFHQTLAMHSRWFGPEVLAASRAPIELALEDPHGTVLVRGDSHRRILGDELDIPAASLRVLPAAIPVPPPAPSPASGRPQEILALTRLSHEKAAIVRIAAQLTRARLDRGLPCHLSVAGDGGWKAGVKALCEELLPPGAWRLESAPWDPFARLAASDLVVAQGQTTLEAAALERRVVVARTVDEERSGGVVLTPERYDVAARDAFCRPPLSFDLDELWREADALDVEDLRALRALVERHNSLEAGASALREALAATA